VTPTVTKKRTASFGLMLFVSTRKIRKNEDSKSGGWGQFIARLNK
jgi:hypothetical protein